MSVKEKLVDVLQFIHENDVMVSSNFAREQAAFVAMAASMGLISTKISMDLYGRGWKLTCGGLKLLNEWENENAV